MQNQQSLTNTGNIIGKLKQSKFTESFQRKQILYRKHFRFCKDFFN